MKNSSLPPQLDSVDAVARLLDHAILQPTQTATQMRAELESLKPFPLASVCIKPYAVPLAVETLRDTPIGIGTVIGFPHGSPLPEVKALEARLAFESGADEVDMVINIGQAVGGEWDAVRADIQVVQEVTAAHNGLLKVIFETGLLLDDTTKIRLCEICSEIGVAYVKTSTGFGTVKQADGTLVATGATMPDLRLMRAHSASSVGVKASGGMRSLASVMEAFEIGATRIGTTSTMAILDQAREKFEGGDAAAQSSADY